MQQMNRQAIFLERDGVINLPAGYVKEPSEFQFLPGAIDALRRIDRSRFELFIATDQPGIAFGKIPKKAYERLTEWMLEELRARDVEISRVYTCPFHPKGKGEWKKESVFRKPNIGIFKMAQQEFNLDLSRCWMIGHRTRDILAAQRARVPDILVLTGDAGRDGEYQVEPSFVERNLGLAVRRIEMQEAALLR